MHPGRPAADGHGSWAGTAEPELNVRCTRSQQLTTQPTANSYGLLHPVEAAACVGAGL